MDPEQDLGQDEHLLGIAGLLRTRKLILLCGFWHKSFWSYLKEPQRYVNKQHWILWKSTRYTFCQRIWSLPDWKKEAFFPSDEINMNGAVGSSIFKLCLKLWHLPLTKKSL